MSEKVLITGGTGLVGKELYVKLLAKGYDVAVLSRNKSDIPDFKTYYWNVAEKKIDKEAIETADYIVHLAGANVSDKNWSEERKKVIIDSRVKTGELLYKKVNKWNKNLKGFISASGINYYGTKTTENIYNETDLPGEDFLAKTCQLWEAASDKFEELDIRTVRLRIGVVLSEKGGALAKLTTPVKFGVGSPIGSGKQYMPWIHIEDLCDVIIKSIEDNNMSGAYNVVTDQHKTNAEFVKTLAEVMNRPMIFPKVPAFVIKTIFGEMGDIILEGSRISAEKLLSTGYKFKFPKLKGALKDLLG